MRRMAPAAMLLLLLAALSCERKPQVLGSVSVGFAPSLTSAIEIVAEDKGFFSAEGIDARLVVYPSGKLAMDDLLANKITLASSATFPFVTHSFVADDLRIVAATAVCGNDNQIVARKSSGISKVEDLRGKRVGVVKGSTTKYVLDLLLVQSGLSSDAVTEVDTTPEEGLSQLVAGTLDALCTLGLWVEKAREGLGSDAVVFSDETLMRVTTILSAQKPWVDANPELLAGVLRAYLRAEEFIRKDPDAAFDCITRYLDHPQEAARLLWQPHVYRVALDQSLLVDLEGLAHWQIAKGMARSGPPPNYLKSVHFAALEALAPDRVKMVH